LRLTCLAPPPALNSGSTNPPPDTDGRPDEPGVQVTVAASTDAAAMNMFHRKLPVVVSPGHTLFGGLTVIVISVDGSPTEGLNAMPGVGAVPAGSASAASTPKTFSVSIEADRSVAAVAASRRRRRPIEGRAIELDVSLEMVIVVPLFRNLRAAPNHVQITI